MIALLNISKLLSIKYESTTISGTFMGYDWTMVKRQLKELPHSLSTGDDYSVSRVYFLYIFRNGKRRRRILNFLKKGEDPETRARKFIVRRLELGIL